jgi:uncharacterized membrane protein YhhN
MTSGMNLHSLFLAALAIGASYYANHWIVLEGTPAIVWKGAGVALLAIWARIGARSLDDKLIAAALGLGALGDVLLETHGLTTGALAFLAGHVVATILYVRHRGATAWLAAPFALLIAALAYGMPADRAAAPGIALYALGLGAMAGTAWFSCFPRVTVGLGAMLFVVSDLLIFSRLGPLVASPLPGLLIWPTYFAGQALIAWGVVTALRREAA